MSILPAPHNALEHYAFRENRCSETYTVLKGINKNFLFSAFFSQFE